VTAEFTAADAEHLLTRPEFRRFLFAAIQSAGILAHHASANGQLGRDLVEGRRSLGFDLLRMVDAGQPEPLRSAECLATLSAAIREAMTPPPKEKTRDRHNDRYADLPE